MTIAVLAVQGAFLEQEQTLDMLGVNYFEIRQRPDLSRPFDGLILPGGESTVQGKLLRELGLFDILKEKIEDGLPVLATCAGMILLAGALADDSTVHFGTMPIRVRRNAYGRQLGSFHTTANMAGIGPVPMTFIRAPYVESVDDGVDVLARVDNRIVAVRYGRQIALSFHPELDRKESTAIHETFLRMLVER
ncbi:MAG: pyridoxal 5'-phosphate synthase glutaminase subunit PdxT [Lachnospiraceae bacterium]|nr:pyridoxal 5'-phosphate synthase glutaminase subunit PdxT [Lachnospiraceae bacterium]